MSLTQAWNEAYPAGTTAANLIDDAMVQMKTQLREVISADHVMASNEGAGAATTGYHNKATFVKQTSDPTQVTDTLMLFSKDVDGRPELHSIDEDGNVVQLTIPLEIKMFGGLISAIPTGWSLCDGTSGRPNLVGKFIRGVNTGATNPGTTGGSDSVTLAVENLPSHTHVADQHRHRIFYSSDIAFQSGTNRSGVTSLYNSYNEGLNVALYDEYITITLQNAGSGTSFDARPAYYELAYIIRSA